MNACMVNKDAGRLRWLRNKAGVGHVDLTPFRDHSILRAKERLGYDLDEAGWDKLSWLCASDSQRVLFQFTKGLVTSGYTVRLHDCTFNVFFRDDLLCVTTILPIDAPRFVAKKPKFTYKTTPAHDARLDLVAASPFS